MTTRARSSWNNTLGELWRRTTIYLPRALARLTRDDAEARCRRQVRPAYVKVAEYQRRGLVHLHVLVRLDRAMPHLPRARAPPAARRASTPSCSSRRLRAAVADVTAPVPDELGGGRVRWGRQLDVRQLTTGDERGEIAGYLAKYATKSTEQAGGLLHRVDPTRSTSAPVREHVRPYMRAAFALDATATEHRERRTPLRRPARRPTSRPTGTRRALVLRVRRAMSATNRSACGCMTAPRTAGRIARLCEAEPARDGTTLAVELDSGELVHLADVAAIAPADRRAPAPDRRDPRLAACAHAFGYRGHCLTKSRRYSTTFKQLRADREALGARADPRPLARRHATRAGRARRAAIVTLECRRHRARHSRRRATWHSPSRPGA